MENIRKDVFTSKLDGIRDLLNLIEKDYNEQSYSVSEDLLNNLEMRVDLLITTTNTRFKHEKQN